MENSQHFITLAEIFQDGMVLQRGKAIKLWGTSQKAQRITVLLDKTVVLEAHIPEGSFAVSLPPQEAAEGRTLCIQNADGETVSVANVDIGEVWIAGGQSNMEFQLQCDRNGDALIASADDVHLRYYEVGKYAFEGEREENLKDGRRWNHWRRFVPSECTHFSAVGTYFARYLRQELGVPVGIIGCCWGGTSATAWMDEALIRKDEQLKIYTDTYDKAVEKLNPEKYIQSDYKYRSFMGAEKNVVGSEATMKKEVTAPLKFPMRQIAKLMQNLLKPGPHSENRPGGLYQTMLSKITGYSIKGVLFYQGESDEHHASLYAHLFTRMIACWRNDWQEQLPFVFVQLPPWSEWMGSNGQNFPVLRAQQQYVEDHEDHVYMASIMDAGSQYDIHPKDKKPVGERLALLALDKVYEKKQAYAQAPRISKIQRAGTAVTLSFSHAEDGLMAQGSIDSLFSLRQGGKELPVTAKICGSTVVLDCPELTDNKASLSFAYEPFLVMNLMNRGNLPARPMEPTEM